MSTHDSAEKGRTPHTHGGTDAPECTRYGTRCAADVVPDPREPWRDCGQSPCITCDPRRVTASAEGDAS